MKYAVITGGTRGIGKQICLDILKRGYFVITQYCNNEDAKKETEIEFSKISTSFEIHKADFISEADIHNFSQIILNKNINIDLFVGNTGMTLRKSFTTFTNKEWEDLFRVNLHSNIFILRDLYPIFNENANIIFIGSMMGKHPHAISAAYGVSKAALHFLAECLVKEFESKKIRVNVISPGFVETEWQKEKILEIRNNICHKTALHRFCEPKEVSQTVLFCVDNLYLNGACIDLHGGYCYK
jgi:3-oxoacyl-[acyl-carrier protein] reductase